jgi:hypothetical protein
MKPPVTEHEHEPVPGLPDELPDGERLVWQGAPEWTALAVHAFRVRAIALYFAVLLGARAAWLAGQGQSAADVLVGCLGPALFAAAALAILALVAWGSARAALYTITTKRVVIRQGIALSTTVNLPFRAFDSASIKLRGNGVGDIALRTVPGQRVGYAVLWPHVRPWRFRQPEPMLRAIPDVARVGDLLTRCFAAAVPASESVAATSPRAEPTRARPPAAPAAA